MKAIVNNKKVKRNSILLIISIFLWLVTYKVTMSLSNDYDFSLLFSLTFSFILTIALYGILNNKISKFNKFWYVVINLFISYQTLDAIDNTSNDEDVRSYLNIINSKIIYIIIHLGFLITFCGLLLVTEFENNIDPEILKLIPLIHVGLSLSLLLVIPEVTLWLYTKLDFKDIISKDIITSMVLIILLILNIMFIFIYKFSNDILLLLNLLGLIIIALLLKNRKRRDE